MKEIKCCNCKKGKIVAEYTKLRDEKKISIPTITDGGANYVVSEVKQ